MTDCPPTTYVRVNRAALRRNLQAVKGALDPTTRLCAVVKANAYGHGLVPTARLFAEQGCDVLGVAAVEEGLELRRAGLETPILVFHPPTDDEVSVAAQNHLTVTITQAEHIARLAEVQRERGVPVAYEVQVDVGLGRSGCVGNPEAFVAQAQEATGHPPSGIWGHIGDRLQVTGDRDGAVPHHLSPTTRHLAVLRERLRAAGEAPLFHVAASRLVCDCPALQWDMVRIGSLLYGAYPSYAQRRPFALSPALELRTRIVELRTIARGTRIGYGGEFRAARETRLATLPVGLYHGVGVIPESAVSIGTGAKRWLALWLGSRGGTFRPPLVRLGRSRAPIVGRISLNECTVDVTSVPEATLGAEVVVPARMTALNPAIPRVYIDDES
ncbi:MAG: alanine racemase [Armatimonadetes bacterium]|nr:alanine racemase [Armatimonadota bacterium]